MSPDAPLPLTDAEVERAAEELIAEHGQATLEKTEERIRALRSEGFESMAKTWELIRRVVWKKQKMSVSSADGYLAALDRGFLLSE
jgi:hypothetical protein